MDARAQARGLAVAGALLALAGASGIAVGVATMLEPPSGPPVRVSEPVAAPVAPPPGSGGTATAGGTPVAASAALTLPRALPVSLEIPAIGVSSPVYDVGLNPDGTIEVPAPGPRHDAAAWYRYSPTPGELGPSVIEGHLDSATGPSVFYRLGELAHGQQVLVRRDDGSALTFEVTGVGQYPKAAFPTADVYGNLDHAGLRLITCGGVYDHSGAGYRDNTVVFARLVSTSGAGAVWTSERARER